MPHGARAKPQAISPKDRVSPFATRLANRSSEKALIASKLKSRVTRNATHLSESARFAIFDESLQFFANDGLCQLRHHFPSNFLNHFTGRHRDGLAQGGLAAIGARRHPHHDTR
jgi:hypothetical protein